MRRRIIFLIVLVVLLVTGFYARDVWETYSDSQVVPIIQEFNPTASRIVELLSQNKWEIVAIDFYGIDEDEVRDRMQQYRIQLARLGAPVPSEKNHVVLTSYPGGRQHIVRIHQTINPPKQKKILSHENLTEEIVRLDEDWKALKRETKKFDLFCWMNEEGKDLCRKLIALIKDNQTVAEAIKRAQRAGLSVRADDDGDVSLYSLDVDPRVSLKKILTRLERAAKEREEYNQNERVAESFHLSCRTSQPRECAAIVQTTQSHVTLQELFKNTRARDIRIFVDEGFRFGAGWMTIDGRASADRIVKFLNTGK